MPFLRLPDVSGRGTVAVIPCSSQTSSSALLKYPRSAMAFSLSAYRASLAIFAIGASCARSCTTLVTFMRHDQMRDLRLDVVTHEACALAVCCHRSRVRICQ